MPSFYPATPEDTPAVLELNDSEVQWTSPMDRERLEYLAGLAAYYKVVRIDHTPVGFMLAMSNDCAYSNANFNWFSQRYSEFLYVDRIVVAASQAGRGIGRMFYQDAIEQARRMGLNRIVCEISLKPMNELSMRFHQRLGFNEVGRQTLVAGGKCVSMQCLRMETMNR